MQCPQCHVLIAINKCYGKTLAMMDYLVTGGVEDLRGKEIN